MGGWDISQNFFFLLLYSTPSKKLLRNEAVTPRRARPESNRQGGISKLHVEARKYSIHILIDFASSVEHCPATPEPFTQIPSYCYFSIFD